MKKIIFFFVFAQAVFAANEVPPGLIEVNPKVYPPKAFRKQSQVKVKERAERVPHPDSLPEPEQRDALFARVPGLADYTAKLDALDQDMLYMRASRDTIVELKAKHPDIPEIILQRLQREAKKP